MSKLTHDHYLKFLAIRQYKPVVIGPLWVRPTGHFLGPISGIGEPEFITPDDLANLIDSLYRGQQLELNFDEKKPVVSVIITQQKEKKA